MIFNVYKHFKDNPSYNKLEGDGYLLLEYKCPIDVEKFQVMMEMNFITYIISGKKDWIIPGKKYTVNEGDAIFLRKGVYSTHQYFDVDHCVLVFFVTDDFIRNFIRENSSISIPVAEEAVPDQIFPLDVDELLQSLFFSIYKYLKMGSGVPRNLVELKFKELLFNIVLNPKNKKLAQYFTSLNQATRISLDAVMMRNFQHDLQLEEFAQLCGRSLSAFKRDFKNVYRQTPGKWLTDKRLEYASSLLLSSDMNINEICFESGFRNSSHFNKVFKDKYQHPPKQFRQLMKMA